MSRWHRVRFVPPALALVAGALAASPAEGQYFGRNKVQYETFDFQVMRTPHFDVYYYPEAEAATRDAARMAERWYSRLSRILDHEFTERQPLVLYGSHPAFQQTTTLSGEVGEGTGGVTEAYKQRVVMPLTGSYQETDHVVGHELVHAFQYDISGLGRFRGSLTPGAQAFGGAPLWFTEGMAEYLSIGAVDPLTAMWLRDAVLSGEVPTLEELTYNPNFFPYRWGQALWAYVGGRWGDAVIGQILTLTGQGTPYQQAFERVLSITMEDLSEDWHVAIRRSYLPLLAERPEAREIARPLITESRDGGRLNIGPSLSPDGRWVAFLSERELDVDLWLADARTGEVIRRLRPGSAFDSHFQSLRYINSAGTWSPDSRRFAFSALRGASDVLVVLNVENGDVIREYEIPDVSEIATPTWSPDGRTIVVSGISGGVSDLYAVDVESGQARRLTSDLYANLHPSFSPDGRTVAFVTDEGPLTNLALLQYGPYQIRLMDAGGGPSRGLPAMEGANINPQWSRDGRSVYFVSDRTGVPNIYRVEVESGQLSQLTALFGGVSGITDTSPAISSARESDRLLFTAYEENGYNIYALSTSTELTGTAYTASFAGAGPPLAAQLPPAPRPTELAFNRVGAILADPTTGLITPEAAQQWTIDDYSPKLGLDYLGQPQVGVAVGGVAGQGGLYGGVSAIFSDLLGYHTLYTTLQAQGQIDEVGFAAIYLNQKHRWNYGAAAQRVPQIYLGQGIEFVPNTPNSADGIANLDLQRIRIFDTSLQGVLQYPFSQNQRVEFSAGLRRLSQSVQVDRYSGPGLVSGGQLVQFEPVEHERFTDEEFSEGYNMAQGTASLIYDSSLSGYTSPFAGQRYHFELSPTMGQLQFVQALADYRRYLFLRPFTLAVRGMHFGRYGRDEEIFGNQFIGNPYFMRGYRAAYNECSDQNVTACNVYQDLLGTRIAVANVELRVPLIRALVIGPIGFPPIEAFGFYDAGVAWDKDTSPVFRRGTQTDLTERGILTSVGAGGRVNLLGYAVLEVSYVRPFVNYRDPLSEDAGKSWHWQFALQPGY